MSGFIRLPEITAKKKACWNYYLVQDLVPTGKSRIREAWEESVRSPRTITEIVVTINRDYTLTRRNVAWFVCSRNSNNEFQIGGWGLETQVYSEAEKQEVKSKITSAIKRFSADIYTTSRQLKIPNQYEIFLAQNVTTHKNAFHGSIAGAVALDWSQLDDASEFWRSVLSNQLSFSSEELEHEWEFFVRGVTSPKHTLWRTQPIRQYPVDFSLLTCLRKAGNFFENNSVPVVNIPTELKEESQRIDIQPNYSELPKLQFTFVVERSLTDAATITQIKSIDDELVLKEVEHWIVANSSEDLHFYMKNVFDDLVEKYSEDLNLTGSNDAIARYFGEKIRVITNDIDLDFSRGIVDGITLQKIEIEAVDLTDKNAFNLDKILQRIRSFLLDKKLILSSEQEVDLAPKVFEKKPFKNYPRSARALCYFFACL